MENASRESVYVLIQYNNDDGHDAFVVGVYKKASKAKHSLIKCIYGDFMEWVDGGGDSFTSSDSSSDNEYCHIPHGNDSDSVQDRVSVSADDETIINNEHSYKHEGAKEVIDRLHKKYPNALSAPKQHDNGRNIPGFDKRNWDHVKPLIIKILDTYKDGYWEYRHNKYGYLDYKVCKQTVK
jgi:hypothetical protein